MRCLRLQLSARGRDGWIFPAKPIKSSRNAPDDSKILPFTYLHVFTYSARPGTPAAEMQNQVPVRVARDRNRILRDLAAQKKLEFMRSFSLESRWKQSLSRAGQNIATAPGTQTAALTDNYRRLRLAGPYESKIDGSARSLGPSRTA